MVHVVGLTGGIGSGKSAVADLFAGHGVPVIDTDVIAHELTGVGGSAIPAIRAMFGSGIIAPTGALDRAAMRNLAFKDPASRKQLEAILHPLIRNECNHRISGLPGSTCYALLVVPLLVESGDYRRRVERVAVVDCPVDMQIARVMARNGLPRSEIEAILAAQASRAKRLAAADDVIDNSGPVDDLPVRIQFLHQTYTGLFCSKG